MKRNKILSSAFVMTMVSFGAFGADKIITSANTCTVDVLGVSDNNATANTIATWDLIDYTLNPGQYLNVTETSVDKITCPAGSYCVGGGYTVETADNSIAQCPTGYPNSANGASADTQCYTACTLASANIAHATAVSGNDYYGTGVDTCGATACETGYHVDGGGIELVEKDPLIPVDYTVVGDGHSYINANGNSGNENLSDAGLTESSTWATLFNYGIVYGRGACSSNVPSGFEYVLFNLEKVMSGELSIEVFKDGLEPYIGDAKAQFLAEILTGVIDGTKTEEDLNKSFVLIFSLDPNWDYVADSTGSQCYCQMTGFKPDDGEKYEVPFGPWVWFGGYDGTAEGCANNCARVCAKYMHDDVDGTSYRIAMYGVLGVSQGGICAANTINIDWNPDNGGEHIKNMCTYDGSVTLPTPDPVKPGYTFTGWKLVE